MKPYYTTYTEKLRKDEGESARRMLRKLRIAFTLWAVSTLAIILWTLSLPDLRQQIFFAVASLF